MRSQLVLLALLGLFLAGAAAYPLPLPQRPPIPIWPDAWKASFTMLAWLENNTNTNSAGALWYDWNQKAERNDHYGTCFVFCNDCDCSFYLIGDLIFKTNDTCCTLMNFIGASPPDWVKACDYVDVEVVNGYPSTHWYAIDEHHYWASLAPGNQSLPVRYSDNSYGTPLQISDFHEVFLEDSIDPSIFNPGDMSVCGQACPPVPAFDALRTMFLRGRYRHGIIQHEHAH